VDELRLIGGPPAGGCGAIPQGAAPAPLGRGPFHWDNVVGASRGKATILHAKEGVDKVCADGEPVCGLKGRGSVRDAT